MQLFRASAAGSNQVVESFSGTTAAQAPEPVFRDGEATRLSDTKAAENQVPVKSSAPRGQSEVGPADPAPTNSTITKGATFHQTPCDLYRVVLSNHMKSDAPQLAGHTQTLASFQTESPNHEARVARVTDVVNLPSTHVDPQLIQKELWRGGDNWVMFPETASASKTLGLSLFHYDGMHKRTGAKDCYEVSFDIPELTSEELSQNLLLKRTTSILIPDGETDPVVYVTSKINKAMKSLFLDKWSDIFQLQSMSVNVPDGTGFLNPVTITTMGAVANNGMHFCYQLQKGARLEGGDAEGINHRYQVVYDNDATGHFTIFSAGKNSCIAVHDGAASIFHSVNSPFLQAHPNWKLHCFKIKASADVPDKTADMDPDLHMTASVIFGSMEAFTAHEEQMATFLLEEFSGIGYSSQLCELAPTLQHVAYQLIQAAIEHSDRCEDAEEIAMKVR